MPSLSVVYGFAHFLFEGRSGTLRLVVLLVLELAGYVMAGVTDEVDILPQRAGQLARTFDSSFGEQLKEVDGGLVWRGVRFIFC